jgi:hypothetical protein
MNILLCLPRKAVGPRDKEVAEPGLACCHIALVLAYLGKMWIPCEHFIVTRNALRILVFKKTIECQAEK